MGRIELLAGTVINEWRVVRPILTVNGRQNIWRVSCTRCSSERLLRENQLFNGFVPRCDECAVNHPEPLMALQA